MRLRLGKGTGQEGELGWGGRYEEREKGGERDKG